MMASLPQTRYTPEQYLGMDRKADHRSEYVNGEILAMAGASREHNRITLNIGAALTALLRGSSCEPFTSDLRVAISPTRYTYPDVVVACGGTQFIDRQLDMLLNPNTWQSDNQWVLTEVAGLDAVLRLLSLGCELPLTAIYERVEFTPDPDVPALEFWKEAHQ